METPQNLALKQILNLMRVPILVDNLSLIELYSSNIYGVMLKQ